MTLILIAIAAAYGYVLLLAYRVGHSGRHARVWSRPRPLRLLSHGNHAAPRPEAERAAAAVETVVVA